MPTYMVTYDLNDRKDYRKLINEIERVDGIKTLRSAWLINVSETSAKQVSDHLEQFIDSDDSLWVLELTKNHDFYEPLTGTALWLSKNPPSR